MSSKKISPLEFSLPANDETYIIQAPCTQSVSGDYHVQIHPYLEPAAWAIMGRAHKATWKPKGRKAVRISRAKGRIRACSRDIESARAFIQRAIDLYVA